MTNKLQPQEMSFTPRYGPEHHDHDDHYNTNINTDNTNICGDGVYDNEEYSIEERLIPYYFGFLNTVKLSEMNKEEEIVSDYYIDQWYYGSHRIENRDDSDTLDIDSYFIRRFEIDPSLLDSRIDVDVNTSILNNNVNNIISRIQYDPTTVLRTIYTSMGIGEFRLSSNYLYNDSGITVETELSVQGIEVYSISGVVDNDGVISYVYEDYKDELDEGYEKLLNMISRSFIIDDTSIDSELVISHIDKFIHEFYRPYQTL